ncbi:hypothetical protein [Pseudomonas sp. URIL14HWK12:I6]|nr:hypothetical protein [Pseudomonas sp. URIL14HWK12:I6]
MLIAPQNVELSTSLQVAAIDKPSKWLPVEYGPYKRAASVPLIK